MLTVVTAAAIAGAAQLAIKQMSRVVVVVVREYSINRTTHSCGNKICLIGHECIASLYHSKL